MMTCARGHHRRDIRSMQRNGSAASLHGSRSHTRSPLTTAIFGALFLSGVTVANAQGQAPLLPAGAADPASWRTEEFTADWGLAAIRADYAYARGLSGRGVRTGIFDSGVGLDHPEFSGKDHHGIQIADVLPDGSRCTNTTIVLGAGACFSSRGDEVEIDNVGFADSVPERVREIIRNGPYVQPGFTYNSHGTHVAGTIVGNRDGNGTHGVAFGSDISAARLFFNRASQWQPTNDGYAVVSVGGVGADSSAFVDMYRQMSDQGVRVLNHSWGFGQEPDTVELLDAYLASPDLADYWGTIADGSHGTGLLQVWAAGNTVTEIASPEQSPIASSHATLPRGDVNLEPYWLSVVNVNRDLVLSNRSSKCGFSMNWCIAAPGTDILSTVYGGDDNTEGGLEAAPDGSVSLKVLKRLPTFGYDLKSGTSMAAPHVTGALALLIERFPYLDNPQVRDVLLTTATDLGTPGIDDIYGWGLVNLEKAIDGPGQIRVDTNVVMNQRAGGIKVWEGNAWDDWRNDIGGPGRLTKSGVGWLRLSGENDFGGLDVRDGVLELDAGNRLGNVEVNGGLLLLNGGLLDTDLLVQGGIASIQGRVDGVTRVAVKGSLTGNGTLGDTVVEGTIAPGNSIGTLHVEGDYIQAPGSRYEAEIAAPSASDLIDVNGHANLRGGTVRVFNAPGNYLLGQRFNILSATGGVSGQFAAIDASAISPFLKLALNYGDSEVDIDVARGLALASAAQTYNQRSAATAADDLATDARLAQTLTQLFPGQALNALDGLSGELHASTHSVLVESSRHVRDAALARARERADTFASTGNGAPSAAWIQLLGSGGTLQSDGNAGEVDYNGSTTLLGYDYRFDSGWRLGVLGGIGRDDIKQTSRRSEGNIKSRRVGLYTGQDWGGFGLRAGVDYAAHDVDADRTIAFPGVQDRTRAEYAAESGQVYIEGGYRWAAGGWEWEPYGQFAQVRARSDRFVESGGVAALTGEAADTRVDLSTLGVRFNFNLKAAQQQDSWLSLRGGLGRRHASGDLAPAASVAWTGGGAFDVHGAPLAENATLAELGLGARVSRNGLLEFNYSEQFAEEARDYGLNARYSLRF
ncbi:MAG TPA: autotransporter domain-containing protein [Lysobacter sp.]